MHIKTGNRAARSHGRTIALLASASIAAFAAATGAAAQDTPAVADPAGEDIIVTGFRASIANAIAEKKNSDLIVESISAVDIGKLPDTSIAEAIARLPGLTTQRLDGRAQVITIRGLAPDFSTTLLNGREQVTTGDNRGVEFDQFPSEIMQQVNVYKTPSANLIGAGLSGTVDLRTIRPLSQGKRVVALNARAEVVDARKLNPESDRWGYRFSGTYIDQFADDTIGIAVSVSHLNQPSQVERFEAWGYPDAGPGGSFLIGGTKPYARSTTLERTAVSGALEWEPSDNFRTTIDIFYSKFKDDEVKRGVELPLAWGNGVPLTNATVTDGLVTSGTFSNVKGVVRNDIRQTDADLWAIGWNAQAGNDVLKATLDISYSGVDRDTLDVETYAGTGRGYVDGSISRGATDTIGFEMRDRGLFATGNVLNYADPSRIFLTSPQGWGGDIIPGGQDGYYNNRNIKDELFALRAGVERELGGGFRSLEVGFNYTGRVKRLTPDEFFLGLVGNTDGMTSVPIPSDLLLGSGANLGFMGLGNTIAYDVNKLLDSGIYNFVRNPNADVNTKGWRVREDVFTGYALLNIDAPLGTSQLTGNVGVQLVQTDQRSDGLASSGSGTGVITTPITDGASYFYALPTLNLVLRGENDLVLRFAAGRQLARARMDDMRASINFGFNPAFIDSTNVENSPWSGGGGNPRLRPWIADSIDLSLEKFFSREGYVAIAGFYKNLDTYIYEQNILFDFTGFPTGVAQEPALREGFVRVWANGEGGSLYGFELSGVLPLNVFSEGLDGFGVQASYSYTESNIQPGGPGTEQPLPGLSKHVWNATAYFERNGFQLRGSIRHRSSFLAEIRGFGGGNTRRFSQPETIVDAQIGYEFQPGSALEGVTLLAQGYNLTNEPFQTYDTPDTRLVRDFESYGRRYLFGVNYRF